MVDKIQDWGCLLIFRKANIKLCYVHNDYLLVAYKSKT